MTSTIFKILENEKIAEKTYRLVLGGDTGEIKNPGQFVNIRLEGFYLRRPISVCDYSEKTLTLIYKTVGNGTEFMSTLPAGSELDILVGLGNGFNTELSGETPLLVGGGVGAPPMYNLCKKLISEGKKPTVVLGFKSSDEVFYEEEFSALGAKVIVVTEDGSKGEKGLVTDVIPNVEYAYFYACGPMGMLKAMSGIMKTAGEYSFEQRMGCGFGACMGCSCKTKNGFKRICREGPVLSSEEIIWEEM
ncbi:MAG: dihydroorotate dehydrogenase electron transfer subunit [Oscillospiraceae bacterium]|nr:dihydroorotate dehydrogenase electron transfer subunit [Oscillospiraceae bacterium]